ncbi:MAG: CvpA family protein [Clostridia bacterium]|nr:CvpA family protein [Clostridia bacterium]
MALDICLGIIFLLSVVAGYRKGFTESFLHTVGWILALILGFVWTPTVVSFLKHSTGIEDALRTVLTERLSGLLPAATDAGSLSTSSAGPMISSEGILKGIPDILSNYFSDASSVIGTNMIENLISIILSIIALLLIILLIKLLFFIIISLFSKKKRKGIIGFSDGALGFLFGGIRGALLICILLALILPLANFTNGEFLLDQLESSTYAIKIYNNNPIFFLTQIFF